MWPSGNLRYRIAKTRGNTMALLRPVANDKVDKLGFVFNEKNFAPVL
jgi:hypothetical protein